MSEHQRRDTLTHVRTGQGWLGATLLMNDVQVPVVSVAVLLFQKALAFAAGFQSLQLCRRLDLALQVFYLRGAGELTVFCAAIMGACIGFLWFNTHPAQVFMGDTGSLALGGALGVISILLKSEFVLLLVGGVFVAEMMSVIIQRFVFKYNRRRKGLEYAQSHRVFRLAPLHHHFEKGGWDESQVVVRFWIIGILCAFLALSTLKLR